MVNGFILALTLVGVFFIIFPVNRSTKSKKRSHFINTDQRPFIKDDDPWDDVDYIKPAFIYPGATDYVPQISKSLEWADPLHNLPAE